MGKSTEFIWEKIMVELHQGGGKPSRLANRTRDALVEKSLYFEQSIPQSGRYFPVTKNINYRKED